MTPSVNGKLRKLCAYFAASDHDENALGPISGSSRSLPNVMLRPDRAEDDEAGRRHPVHETLEGIEAHDVACPSGRIWIRTMPRTDRR